MSIPAGERDALIRRNTRLLAIAQGCIQATFPVLLVVGGPAATRLTGDPGAAGWLWGVYFIAAASGALTIGRWMDRVGRRPGLLVAFATAGLAGIGCVVSIAAGSFAGLLASSALFGVAAGGSNLARGAIADMYAPSRRGHAVGMLLAAGTTRSSCRG